MESLARHVEAGAVPGLAWLVARGDDVRVEVLGTPALNDPTPLQRDAIFRIASLSKPIAAAGAMTLVDDGVLSLNESVEKHLPELADRRVLRNLDGPLDDTVPAERSITVEDLLTCRLGFGVVMAPPGTYPIQCAEAELNLRTMGPPWPPPDVTADEWIARFATLPLLHQPGAGFRYNTGIHVLGILLERATGQPLETFLRSRVFEPLGMTDTGFSVPAASQPRLTTAYVPAEGGGLQLLDPPSGGWWNAPPSMADAGGMLVSTLDDYWAFVSMLLANGSSNGNRVLSPAAVAAMTSDHLTASQRASGRPILGEHDGWGYGMAVPGPHPAGVPAPVPSGFGWNGGMGTTWRSDPVRGITAILFTQRAMTSPEPTPLFMDFYEAAYTTLDN